MPARPLVVLGFDVGDPDRLLEWAHAGLLPTLASLLERGAWARTSGPDLINEHSVWVSLLSGVPMSRHGFYYYRRQRTGTYELETITGREAEARPFWAHVPEKRVAVIDAPHFYPESTFNGIHVSEWATHHPYYPPASSPPELLEKVRSVFGPQIRIPEVLESSLVEDRRIYQRALARIERKGALCRELLAGEDFDAIVTVFADSHLATHQFWEYRKDHRGEPKVDPEGILDQAIPEVFHRIDRELGSLLAGLPPDADVCIVSSTGMLDHFPTTGLMESFCRTLGYQASPPVTKRVRPLGLLRELLPERVRYALSSRLPASTQERLMNEKFRGGTDWDRTTMFAIPTFFTSFLRVNLEGREPRGQVAPGAEYAELLERIEADLRLLRDPETGEPLVADVLRASTLHDGEPPDLLPDLFVEWVPHIRYRERAVHPRGEIVAYPPEIWRGNDHSRSGFMALAGPSIGRGGDLGEVSLLDLAPTFLALLGKDPVEEMVGRPLDILAGDRHP